MFQLVLGLDSSDSLGSKRVAHKCDFLSYRKTRVDTSPSATRAVESDLIYFLIRERPTDSLRREGLPYKFSRPSARLMASNIFRFGLSLNPLIRWGNGTRVYNDRTSIFNYVSKAPVKKSRNVSAK